VVGGVCFEGVWLYMPNTIFFAAPPPGRRSEYSTPSMTGSMLPDLW
jgi:hypothetical protein